jgi:GH25 family lysozyme M1 (1,4-beta-N-acetylmuramidase)
MSSTRRLIASVLLFAAAFSGQAVVQFGAAEHASSKARVSGWDRITFTRGFTEVATSAMARGAIRSGRAVIRVVPEAGLRGIDVSHYQGRIDWRRVSRSGHHFAIAKATEGHNYVDPTYLRNKWQAEASGVAFGAYHFARPDRRPNDPIREANHFLDVAHLEPGNVIPVLDLETTGGLSKRRITRWILVWLRRVRERLGVRAMVYTSPLGWSERTGNTTAVARAGYDVWVAHWGVRRPTLPARGWGGKGWTMWQRSACGSVPGIRGCVDVDHLVGRSLAPVTITRPDTRAPTVRIAPAADLTGPIVVSFDEVVGGVTPANLELRATGAGPRPVVTLACRSGIGLIVDCATGDVRRVYVTPRRPLVPGQAYQVVVNAPTTSGRIADRASNQAPGTSRGFVAPRELEQGSVAIAYRPDRAWKVIEQRERRGGRVAVSGLAAATVTLTFRGTGIEWTTVVGPNHGIAEMRVDGRLYRSVDTYARVRTLGVRHAVEGLPAGVHTLRILVLGESDPRASGTVVAIDRFAVIS